MGENTEDICYFAHLNHELGREKEAMKCLDQLIETNPQLQPNQLSLFFVIYKESIDPLRSSIRTLITYYDHDMENQYSTQAQFIQFYMNKVYEELKEMCNHVIELIDQKLLPNAQDAFSQVQYYKIRGDMYRYLLTGKKERDDAIAQKSKESYEEALKIVDQLHPCNPARLGVSLNYAVLEYDIYENVEHAIDLLTELLPYHSKIGELETPEEQAEALNTYKMIKGNLFAWRHPDLAYDEEEEEEDPIE